MENVDVSFDYIGELRALIPLMAEAFSHNFYPVVRLLAYAVSSFYKKDVEGINIFQFISFFFSGIVFSYMLAKENLKTSLFVVFIYQQGKVTFPGM